ncbi:MAG: hypothetical protein ACOC56_00565 [Atribacterota bacterium]
MLDLPSWLKDNLSSYKCLHCKKHMVEDHIIGVGIRQSSKYEGKTVFFFEYDCPFCENRLFVELDLMSVEDYVFEMIEQYSEEVEKAENTEDIILDDNDHLEGMEKHNQFINDKHRKRNCRISKDEVEMFFSELNDAHSWDDIMLSIGLSEEEIEKNKEQGCKERELYKNKKKQ